MLPLLRLSLLNDRGQRGLPVVRPVGVPVGMQIGLSAIAVAVALRVYDVYPFDFSRYGPARTSRPVSC